MLPKKKNLEEERAKHTVDSLYKDYVDDLFSYALGFGFDKQTAMDAIHDVFCRVCIREKEVQEIQNPKFYLLRALRNQLIDTYKLKRNYSEVLTGEITDELPYKIKITVEDEIIAAEEQAEVSQKVDEENRMSERLAQVKRDNDYLDEQEREVRRGVESVGQTAAVRRMQEPRAAESELTELLQEFLA